MLKSILYSAIIMFSTLGYAAEVGPLDYMSKDGDFSILIPKQWEITKDVMGADVVAIAPSLDPQDLFHENFNIISAKFDFPMSKEEYYSLNIRSLSDLLTDFDLENSEDVSIGGQDARKIVFTHRIGVVNVRVIQYLFLKGQKAVVLSFTADTLEYPKMRTQFDEMISTFKLVK